MSKHAATGEAGKAGGTGVRSVYESAWSAKPLDSQPQIPKPEEEGQAAETRRGQHDTEPGRLRRLWSGHAPEIVLGIGVFLLVFGGLLAFLGIRAESEDQVTPGELARATAALEDEADTVARGRQTVDTYLLAVEEFVVNIAELEALSAEELAKSEEIAAAFGADLQTFNRLVNERNAILARINIEAEEVQQSAAAVDEAFSEIQRLGEVAGRAREGGGD